MNIKNMKIKYSGFTHIHNGSSLFELIIYIAISITLLYLSSVWLYHAYIPFSRTSGVINTIAALSGADTAFFHDIYQAPTALDAWQKRDVHEIIWAQDILHIGWQYHDHMLKRIEGYYNSVTGTWHDAVHSIMAQGVSSASFEVGIKDNTIKTVSMNYVIHGVTYTKLIKIRDRFVHEQTA